eukprot:TRINITY_DN12063_c0_g1_i1.p1 TRINITY_DN12063_c0_g1~~TRINITY_DN12063_c0_g1_i1.p1  ORF type:complete len:1006 (+),score=309.41 TRINITY_DN12063_c0_g1_i1:142-3159(+)
MPMRTLAALSIVAAASAAPASAGEKQVPAEKDADSLRNHALYSGPPAGLVQHFSYKVNGIQNTSSAKGQAMKRVREEGEVKVKHMGCRPGAGDAPPLCRASLEMTEVPSSWQCDSRHDGECLANPNQGDQWERIGNVYWPILVDYRPGEGIVRFLVRKEEQKTTRGNASVGYKQGLATTLFDVEEPTPRGRRGQAFDWEGPPRNMYGSSRGTESDSVVHGVSYVDHVGDGNVEHVQKYITPPTKEQWKDYQYHCPLTMNQQPRVEGRRAFVQAADGSYLSAENEIDQYAMGDADAAAAMPDESQPHRPPAFHSHYHAVMTKIDPTNRGNVWGRRSKTLDESDYVEIRRLDARERSVEAEFEMKHSGEVPENPAARQHWLDPKTIPHLLKAAIQCAVDRTGDIPKGEQYPQTALREKMDSECLQQICQISQQAGKLAVPLFEEAIDEALEEEPVEERRIWAASYGLTGCLGTDEAQQAFVDRILRSSVYRISKSTRSKSLFNLMMLRPPADVALEACEELINRDGNEDIWLAMGSLCSTRLDAGPCLRFQDELDSRISTAEKEIRDKPLTQEAVNSFQMVALGLSFVSNMGGCHRFLKTAFSYAENQHPPPVRVLAAKAMRRMECKEAEKRLVELGHPDTTYRNHSRIQLQAINELRFRSVSREGVSGLRSAWERQRELEKQGWNADERLINTHHNTLHSIARVSSQYNHHPDARHVSRGWMLKEIAEQDWESRGVRLHSEAMGQTEAAALADRLYDHAGPVALADIHGGLHHGKQHTQTRFQAYANGPERKYDCRSKGNSAIAQFPVRPAASGAELPSVLGMTNVMSCMDAALNATLLISHGGGKETMVPPRDAGEAGKVLLVLKGAAELVFTEKHTEGILHPDPKEKERGVVPAKVVTLRAGDAVSWGPSLAASLLIGSCEEQGTALMASYATSDDAAEAVRNLKLEHGCAASRCKELWAHAERSELAITWPGWLESGRRAAHDCGPKRPGVDPPPHEMLVRKQ